MDNEPRPSRTNASDEPVIASERHIAERSNPVGLHTGLLRRSAPRNDVGSLAQQYPPPSVIASEAKQSAQRFALSLWKGRLVWIASPTATVLPQVRNDVGPLAKQFPPRGVLFGVVTPVGNRFLNSPRPKEACYSVLSFRPGEHHRKAAATFGSLATLVSTCLR
jgi:hypothetical protein